MPGRRVDFDTVVTNSPVHAAVGVGDRLDRVAGGEHEELGAFEVDGLGIDREPPAGQLVNPMAKPLLVEVRSNPLAVIGDTENDRSAARRVRQARELVRQVARRILVLSAPLEHSTTRTSATRLLLAVDLPCLDLGRVLTCGEATEELLDLLGERVRPEECKGRDYPRHETSTFGSKV